MTPGGWVTHPGECVMAASKRGPQPPCCPTPHLLCARVCPALPALLCCTSPQLLACSHREGTASATTRASATHSPPLPSSHLAVVLCVARVVAEAVVGVVELGGRPEGQRLEGQQVEQPVVHAWRPGRGAAGHGWGMGDGRGKLQAGAAPVPAVNKGCAYARVGCNVYHSSAPSLLVRATHPCG